MNKNFDKTLFLQHNQYLSFLDLEKIDGFIEAWKTQDEDKFVEILHTHGMDIEWGWDIDYALHRPRTSNQVEYGLRVTFKERTDKEFEKYRCVEDLARDDKSSVVRFGMVQSLNSGVHLNDAIEEQFGIDQRLLQKLAEDREKNEKFEKKTDQMVDKEKK